MIDVLILCAIPVEWNALRKLFSESTHEAVATDPAIIGIIPRDGRTYTGALVEVGTGSVNTSMSALVAVQKYRPRLVMFVGVAGGRKDVSLGDVVIASKVHYYETGKSIDGHFQARADSPTAPESITGIARYLSKHFDDATYKVVVGAIASGEKVVADSNSHEAAILSQSYGDSLAVEMEGSGFFKAMRRLEVSNFVLVRGVSDLLDGKSGSDASGWQPIAARNATEIAGHFLDLYFDAAEPDETPGDPSLLGGSAAGDDPAEGAIGIDLELPVPSGNEAYVLMCGPSSKIAEATVLSGVPVSLVIDFDSMTDRQGVMSNVKASGFSARVLHLGTPTAPPTLSRNSTSWMCIRGFDDEEITELQSWKRSARKQFRRFLTDFGELTGGRQIVLIVAGDNGDWNGWSTAVIDDLMAEFGSQLTVGLYGRLLPLIEADYAVECGEEEYREAIGRLVELLPAQDNPSLPGESGLTILDARDAAWLREDMEPVGIGVEYSGQSDAAALDFLRGGEITWWALNENVDVLRSDYAAWRKSVEGVLKNRRTLRLNLFHAPGAGGTTMGRRTLYDLHTTYPSVIVERFRPIETARRIDFLARKSGLTVLCLVDSVRVSDVSVSNLLSDLHASSTSAVLLYVARRYSPPSSLSNSPYLEERVDDAEAARFVETFSERVPQQRRVIEEVGNYPDGRRNPFMFGLSAFEDEFTGLDAYVSRRVQDLPEDQTRLLVFCAIAHYYGQLGVPEYAVARLIGLPASKSGSVARVLRPETRGLLWRSPAGEWRTTHQLVAHEILMQMGGGKYLWKRHLTTWGHEFAKFLLSGTPLDEDLLRLAEAVFIQRGSQELLGSASGAQNMFSRLIEDVPSAEGAVELLAAASDLVPHEAHFAAHVARYYAFKLRDFPKASEFATRASALDPRDNVLHHVLGMVHRSRTYDAIGRGAELAELEPWVKLAADEFGQARELAPPSEEYAYISEIQLRIALIDYGIRGYGSVADYLAGKPEPLIVESVTVAEDLLSSVRYLGDARNPSGYEKTNRAKLTALYGDYEKALQLFNSLLDKPGHDSVPVRRQLVWTYLARVERDWRRLNPKSTERVLELLEQNLREGDYSANDVRQWWRAIRYQKTPPSQDRVHEVLTYWRESYRSPESLYCSYVVYALDAFDGSHVAVAETQRYQGECSRLSGGDPRAKLGIDWLGSGTGIKRLVHQSELGRWDPHLEFWSDTSRLRRIEARISDIRGPQAGNARFHGISVFFVPARAGVEKGRHENHILTGYLAFSRDGVRLWDAELLQE